MVSRAVVLGLCGFLLKNFYKTPVSWQMQDESSVQLNDDKEGKDSTEVNWGIEITNITVKVKH